MELIDKIKISGKEYILGNKIAGGKEGTVYDVEGFPKYVVKIINDSKMSDDQRIQISNHLKWLKNLRSTNKDVKHHMALPNGIVDDHLGYIMKKATDHEPLKNFINMPNDENFNFDEWYLNKYSFKKRYQIIINLFDSLRDIHLAGLIFTDLSPNNIMVHKTENQIVFIDTDNTRRRTDMYNGILGTPGYMAPEVYRKNIDTSNIPSDIDVNNLSSCGRLSQDTDIFSAAVIAFQLLTLNHPFIGDIIDEGTAEDEERALRIETDYIFKEGTKNTSTSCLTTIFDQLTTPKIRDLFYRTFVDSISNPNLRPTAEDFLEAFEEGKDLIIECPKCGYCRIYDYKEDNKCINCGEPFDSKVSLIIYNIIDGLDRDEIINSIGNYNEFNISLDNLRDHDNKLPENCFELSRVILEPGKNTLLFGHNFELNTDRTKPYALVCLDESLSDVRFELNKNHLDYFTNSYLIKKENGKIEYLKDPNKPTDKQGKFFNFNNYNLIIEKNKNNDINKKYKEGNMQIRCVFIKG